MTDLHLCERVVGSLLLFKENACPAVSRVFVLFCFHGNVVCILEKWNGCVGSINEEPCQGCCTIITLLLCCAVFSFLELST